MEELDKSNAIYPCGFLDTEGRIGRTRYAAYCLLAVVAMVPISVSIGYRNTGGQLMLFIAGFVALAPTAVKRLHDIDRNGTWVWALLIPFVSVIVQLRLLFQAGNPDGNRFGIRSGAKGGTKQFLLPVTQPWWKLDKRLRLVIVASTVWMLGSYFMQEKYDEDMGVVFIPAFAALVLHFLVRFTVDRAEYLPKNTSLGQSLSSSSELSTAPNDIYAGIAQEFETGTLDKGLWIRLFAECEGDETKTKVHYIRERMLILSTFQSSQPTKSTTLGDDNTRVKDSAPALAPVELSPKERERAMEEMIKRMR